MKMRRSLLLQSAIVLGALAVAGACFGQTPPATTQQPPVSLSPAMPATDPAKMAEPSVPKADAVPVDASYVLGPEDQISITMWDEPKFDGSYTIRPDGMISVKLVGEIKASGLTPMQLQDAVNKAVGTLIRTPRATVNVMGVHSKHIYFDGEGIAPGAMDLVIPIHLLEGLSARGGFRDFADKKHIKILRDGKTFMTVNYKDLVSGKHPELNIELKDKDHVVVN
jgi:polysaccharide export outer membrane protein